MGAFLEVTTIIGCPNQCEYCPQDLFLSKYKSEKRELSLEDFKTAVGKLPPDSTIAFAGFSEPVLASNFIDMLLYVHEKKMRLMLLTTLVGLSIDAYDIIRHLEFDHLSIHLPDKASKTVINITDEYLELLEYVVKNPPKGTFLLCEHSLPLHDKIAHLIDDSLLLNIHDRSGNVETKDEILHCHHIGNIKCGHRFLDGNSGILLPNGDIELCCSSWGLEATLGNILTQSWEEIMDSPVYHKVCKGNQNGEETICRKCYLATQLN